MANETSTSNRRPRSEGEERVADTFGRRAIAHLDAGRFDAAVAAFDQALEHDPERCDLLVELAKTHLQLGRFDKAFDAYAAATDIHRAHNRTEIARELLTKMTRLEPEDILRHAKLSELLAKLGKEERAVEQIENCTDKLLNERDDLEGFLQMARRILELEPNFDVLRSRIIELMVGESHAYIRYNLHGQAKRLLETAEEYCPDNRNVRESLAELYIDSGQPGEATEQFLALAEISHRRDNEERAHDYLRQACAYADDGERVREVSEELGVDYEELSECVSDASRDWAATDSGLGEEETDPEQPSALFDQASTATNLQPPPLPGDVGGGESVVGLDEPTELTDGQVASMANETSSASPKGALVPCDGIYEGLLGLLKQAEHTSGMAVMRIQSADQGPLGRMWVQQGRVLPGIVVDDEIYRDDDFEEGDSEFLQLFSEAEPEEWLARLSSREGPWSPGELEPAQALTARGLCEILRRGEGQNLVVSVGPGEDDVESPVSFSGRALIQSVARHLTEDSHSVVEKVFEAAVDEEFNAWLMASESNGGSGPWLPIRSTYLGRNSVSELSQIGDAVAHLAATFADIQKIDDSPGVSISVLLGETGRSVFVQSDRRIAVVEVPQNLLGAVLNTIQSVADSTGAGDGEETSTTKTPEADKPGQTKEMRQ